VGHVPSMAQNSQNFDFLKKNYIYNKAFGSCHIHTFYAHWHIKVFVVKILGQKKLFTHSLWVFELFFSWDNILDVFQRLGKNP